jgi:nucleotide-binding universal stress UspA family protein
MKPIMLATDGSPTAEEATETAIELAKALDAELVVVTVWEIPYTTVGLAPAPVTEDLAKLSEGDARRFASAAAARAEEAGVESRTVVLRGITVQEICAAAEKFGPRLVVVGSRLGRGEAHAVRQRLNGRSASCELPCAGRSGPRRACSGERNRGARPRAAVSARFTVGA